MRMLTLAVILTVMAPFAWAGEWSDEDLDDKFRDVDKQLRLLPSLEKRSRSFEKRLEALEAKVRDAQTKLDLLEFQLDSIESKLKKIQEQLAALAGQKPEQPTPKATKPKEEPKTPAVATFASIRSQGVAVMGEFLQITGVVANTSSKPLTFVLVEATFLDGSGHIVKTASGYTSPRVIPPGGTATFKIMTRRDPRIRNHRLTVRSQ